MRVRTRPSLGVPVDQAWAELFVKAEQVELTTEPSVVAALGFFQPV